MTSPNQFPPIAKQSTATIANGGTTSGAIDLGGCSVVGLITPAMTGTSVTFEVSHTAAGTFNPLFDRNGAQVSATVSTSASRAISLEPSLFAGWQFVKIKSSGTEAAERDITVVSRPV